MQYRGRMVEAIKNGRPMTLEDYDIEPESSIHLVLRLSGGTKNSNYKYTYGITPVAL